MIAIQELEVEQPLSIAPNNSSAFLFNISVSGKSKNTTILCNRMRYCFNFLNVQQLLLSNITLTAINAIAQSEPSALLTISRSMHILILDVKIVNGTGAGLYLNNTGGNVTVGRSLFQDLKNGSGLKIKISDNFMNYTKAQYTIVSSKFYENRGWNGGGLSIVLRSTAGMSFSITDCYFSKNSAHWGGGLFVAFKGDFSLCQNNSITVLDSIFKSNYALRAGGGASLGYYMNSHPTVFNNTISLDGVDFIENQAGYGGGTVYHSGSVTNPPTTEVMAFKNCQWIRNTAHFSAAVDVCPYYKTIGARVEYFLSPHFFNSTFSENQGNLSGIFSVTLMNVFFGGFLNFSSNSNTALHLASAIAQFLENSSVNFENNLAVRGGGIVLFGFSRLTFKENSSFVFTGNTALQEGGAIYYYSYDQHDYVINCQCFIDYIGEKNKNETGTTFMFANNSALSGGASLFASSLFPCYFSCNKAPVHNISKAFDCIAADFKWNLSKIATYGFKFTSKHDPVQITPGYPKPLGIIFKDEFHRTIDTAYMISLSDENVKVDSNILSSDTVTLYGREWSNFTLTLTTLDSSHQMAVTVNVSLLLCPPGLTWNKEGRCACDMAITSREIICNHNEAYIHHGSWVGYLNVQGNSVAVCTPSANSTSCSLYRSPCPNGFCYYEKKNKSFLNPVKLPSTHNIFKTMCGRSKKGVLCKDCVDGKYLKYHSKEFTCKNSTTCDYGVVLYILAELVPVTVLFTVLLIFNIKLTSGSMNGFLLFAQSLIYFDISGNGVIQISSTVTNLTSFCKFIYGFFKLDFFNAEVLSFCLWKKATIFDIIAIKYFTAAYALTLVILLVFIMKYCNVKPFWTKVYRNSTVHGITAFFLICYAEYTNTTFLILTPMTLHEVKGNTSIIMSYFGGSVFFGKEHIIYAIPACFVLVTFVLLPPLLLLVYPLNYKVMALLRIEDSAFITKLSKCFWFSKLKPIMDSFQGYFKDNYRFFGGLYFLYRLLPPVMFCISHGYLEYFILIEVVFIAMLVIHVLVQPYSCRWHNIIDCCMFADLAIINGLTIFNYSFQSYDSEKGLVEANTWIQIVLLYLPLVYISVYYVIKLTGWAIKLRRRKMYTFLEPLQM